MSTRSDKILMAEIKTLSTLGLADFCKSRVNDDDPTILFAMISELEGRQTSSPAERLERNSALAMHYINQGNLTKAAALLAEILPTTAAVEAN